MTTFKKFFLWLFCILIFFSILLSSNGAISGFWDIVLLIVFVIGVISFLAIFISLFQKLLLFISVLFQRKINKKIIIVFISLSIILFTFYWFQLRPSQIKASCQKEADEYHKRARDLNDEDKNGLVSFSVGKHINQITKDRYSFCLHRNGL